MVGTEVCTAEGTVVGPGTGVDIGSGTIAGGVSSAVEAFL